MTQEIQSTEQNEVVERKVWTTPTIESLKIADTAAGPNPFLESESNINSDS